MDTYFLLIWMLIFSAMCTGALALYGSRLIPGMKIALPYTLLMIAATGFACVHLLELLSETLQYKTLFHNLRFLFLPYIAILELWLILEYVRKPEWITKEWVLPALAIPVAATLLALTSPWHTLFRYNFSLVTTGSVSYLDYSESLFFHIYSGFSLALLIITYLILFNESSKTQTLFEKQTIILFAALLIPTVITYLFVLGITPVPGINMAAPLFWISAILFTIALFRYRFLDIIPAARSHLVDRMSLLMLVLDREGYIIDANPASYAFFSREPGTKGSWQIDDAAQNWPELLSFCREEESKKRELKKEDDGTIHYFNGTVDLLTNANRELDGRLILLQDITRERVTQNSLNEVDERYRLTINAVNDGIWDWDLRTGKTFFSPIYYTMLGYEPGEFEGSYESFLSLIHPEERKLIETEIERHIKTGDTYTLEFRARRRDGGYSWIQSRGTVVERDDEKKPVRVLGTHTDISTRKQSEEALRLANKKLQLLSSVTRHDILNQIMVIQGYLDFAGEENDNPIQTRYLGKVHDAAEVIEKQIAFTREYEQLGVKEPIWLLVQNLVEKLRSGDIAVACDCAGYSIYCDPMIEKVFYNLMDNTIRHAEGAATVTIGCTPLDTGLLISWQDDGPGIPDDEKEQIFMRGFGKNTGFGLFIIREILAITGITITETGVYGEGARFEIKVPRDGYRRESPSESLD
ncbi:PAS domain S-box protein [Methanocalculus taiwanensis]|uniref:histidine kinase n=1 Tax=Methanocalculus taiwanensis TaxID=106207 RepID=A0ABD4TFI4_9EURY|nr:histidine kinase N-terminal 7TM domain-containing protein [Methanocalculus taiwanensis]MCQ1537471.1 PAS domain S-box protein [Methanocalculus taiwanensis]